MHRVLGCEPCRVLYDHKVVVVIRAGFGTEIVGAGHYDGMRPEGVDKHDSAVYRRPDHPLESLPIMGIVEAGTQLRANRA